MSELPAAVAVREATDADELGVRRVLDAAMLETDAVSDAVDRGDALVAAAAEQVIGAVVLVPVADVDYPTAIAGETGVHVDAIAVTRRRRGRGIGRGLLQRAIARTTRLTAAFDDDVREFYDALAFDVVAEDEDGRLWAERTGDAST